MAACRMLTSGWKPRRLLVATWSPALIVTMMAMMRIALADSVVYVSLAEENAVVQFRIDPDTGALTRGQRLPVEGSPGAMAVDRERRHLYVAVRSTGSVASMRLTRPTGVLVPMGTTPLVGDPVYLACDRTGNWLLTAYYEGGKIAVYPIGRDGRVGAVASHVLDAELHPHAIQVNADNEFAYVPNTGSDSILQFRLNAQAGTLAPLTTPRVPTRQGAGPRHFTWHPRLKVLYVANELNCTVAAYRVEARTGQLSELAAVTTLPADFKGKNTCADIHITPRGTHLYVSNRGHESLAIFEVHPGDGRLSLVGVAATEATPRSFGIEPMGQYLYAAGQTSGRLAAYRIETASGRLERISTYEVGRGPAWVAIVDLAE